MNWPCTAADRLLALIIASVRLGVWRPVGTACDQWSGARGPTGECGDERLLGARRAGERQPRIAGSLEVGAVDDRHACARERVGDRLAGVGADEEERSRRGHRSRETRCRVDGCEGGGAVGDEPGVDGVQPVPRPLQHGERGRLGGEVDAQAVPLERARALGDASRRAGNDSKPELRQRQALAEAANDHDVVGQAEGRRERRAVPERGLVRLVGHDEQAVPLRDPDGVGHLLARGNVPGGVPGVAEEQSARPRSDRAPRAPRDPSATRPTGCRGRRPASRRRRGSGLRRRSTGPARRPRRPAGRAIGSRARGRASPRS